MSTTHNGWPNPETWRLQLHLANNEELAAWCAACASIAEAGGGDAVEPLAACIRDHVQANVEEMLSGDGDGLSMFVADTMETVLARVEWAAIARAWLEPAGVRA